MRVQRPGIHEFAAEVVHSPSTPEAIIRGIARDSRLRAVAQRERSEGIAERTRRLEAEHIEQRERLGQWIGKTAARIRTESRSDALNLSARLSGYRWYLIALDERRWSVVVEVNGDPNKLPQALRDDINEWMNTRSLPSVQIRLGNSDLTLYP